MKIHREWQGLVRGLGEALVELAAAEFENLRGEFSSNGRTLGTGLGLALVTLALGFWTVGMLVVTLVVVLATQMPVWGASVVVLLVLCLTTLVFGFLALRRAKELKSPTLLVQDRWRDHLDWWQTVRGALGEPRDSIDTRAASADPTVENPSMETGDS